MTPAQVDECTLWEFAAALAGWNEANKPSAPQAMSDDRARELGIAGF